MFFVIPEMPFKTFVMVLKKIPDHFKLTVSMPREDQLRVLENKAWVKNIDFNKGPILFISTISTTTITTTTRKHFDTIYIGSKGCESGSLI